MPLDPSISFRALAPQQPSFLSLVGQAQPIAQRFRQQRQQEQLTDIFARNIETTPEGTQQLNKVGALTDLYKVQPVKALEFERQWQEITPAPIDPRKKLMDDINFASQILSGTTDPLSASRTLLNAGIDISDMPSPGTTEWDAWKQNRINMGVKAKDLFSFEQREADRKRRDKQQELLARKLGLEFDKFGLLKEKSERQKVKIEIAGRRAIEDHRQMKLKKSEQINGVNSYRRRLNTNRSEDLLFVRISRTMIHFNF